MPYGNPTTTLTCRVDARTRSAIEATARLRGASVCAVASEALAHIFQELGQDVHLGLKLRERIEQVRQQPEPV